jgi:hypothetical protein
MMPLRRRPGGRVSHSDWNDVRRDRVVKNEIAFRDYNNRRVGFEQRVVGVEEDAEQEVVPFVCECGNADCISALTITVGEYEDAHSAPNQFIVRPNHFYPDVEDVTGRHEHYWVVEKRPDEMPPIGTTPAS